MSVNSLREWTEFVIREIGRDELTSMMQAVAVWGLLGGVLGFVLGLAAYRILRRCGWYGATSTAGRWMQRGVCAATSLLCTALIGGAGVWEGVRRECHDVVTRSRIGTDLLPAVADVAADCLAWIDLAMQPGESYPTDASDPRLTEFRAGTREIDVAVFLRRVDSLRDEVFQSLLVRFEEQVLKESPALKGGLGEKLLHETIQALGPILLEQKLSSEIRRRGLDQVHDAIRTRLTAEATRSGDPATIGYRDLSRFIQHDGIVPAIVVPVRSLARQQQMLYVLIALFMAFGPAVVFRICRRRAVPPASAVPAGSVP